MLDDPVGADRGVAMTVLTPGELLAVYAILSTSKAAGAPALAARILTAYKTQRNERQQENE